MKARYWYLLAQFFIVCGHLKAGEEPYRGAGEISREEQRLKLETEEKGLKEQQAKLLEQLRTTQEKPEQEQLQAEEKQVSSQLVNVEAEAAAIPEIGGGEEAGGGVTVGKTTEQKMMSAPTLEEWNKYWQEFAEPLIKITCLP